MSTSNLLVWGEGDKQGTNNPNGGQLKRAEKFSVALEDGARDA